MRPAWRDIVVLLTSVLLATAPVLGVRHEALGFVLMSQAAQIDNINAVEGTNVYAGDTIATTAKGFVRVQSPGNQIYLFGSSKVTMSGAVGGMVAQLTEGIAGFSTSGDGQVALKALGVTISPAAHVSTDARVAVAGPNQLLVASIHGALNMELDGSVYTVPDGKAFRATIQSPSVQSEDAGKHPAKKRGAMVLVIFGGAVGGYAALQLYHELTESPDLP